MKALLYLISFLSVYSSIAQTAQPAEYHVSYFTNENGLPQSSITGMAFDDAGFMWIGTQGGLVRFDGQKMKVYTKLKLGVDSDRIVRLKRDFRSSRLFAINEHGQIIVIRDGHVYRESQYTTERALELDAFINQDLDGIKVDTSKTSDDYSKYTIVSAAPGRYCIYSRGKIIFFNQSRFTKAIGFPGKPYFSLFPVELSERRTVVRETKGMICAENFTSIGGKFYYHLGSEGDRFLELSENGASEIALEGDITLDSRYKGEAGSIRIVTNRMKRQVFAVLGSSIYLISRTQGGRLRTTLLVRGFGVSDNLVSRMVYDENNHTLLLGSFSRGLVVMRKKQFRVLTNDISKDYHNVFYAQVPFTSSSVIVPDGTILGNQANTARNTERLLNGAPASRYFMLKDRGGFFWIVKEGRLYKLAPDAVSVERSWQLFKEPTRLYQTSNGAIYIGFKTGEIGVLRSGSDSLTSPKIISKVNAECTYLYQDKPGRIWLGTTNGLFLLDNIKRAVYSVKGLVNKNIRSVYASPLGFLLITTHGDGMYLLKDNKLIKLPLDKNGYLSHAHCVLEDARHHLWIPTNKGLFRAASEDLSAYAAGKLRQVFYVYYNADDGFYTSEFNGGCQPCGVKLDDGHFSFPSMRGLVWFRPGTVTMPDLHAGLIFENFDLDSKKLALADTLRVPYNFSHFSLEARSSFNGLPDNQQTFFVTKDNQSTVGHWSQTGQDQRVDVYRLPSGTYTLLVRKTSGFGGKYIEKKLVFIVEQAWYLAWWFVALTFLALALAFWLFSKWRMRRLSHQNLLLTQKVEERTENLRNALESLRMTDQALQKQLQNQMRIISVINHDLHSPLRYLNTYVPRFMQQVTPHLADKDMARMGNAIGQSVTKVYDLTDDLLSFIKNTEYKKGEISCAEFNLKNLLDQKTVFFSEIAREKETLLLVECDPDLTIKTNYIMLGTLMHNLLDNALKHTFSQKITVTGLRLAEGSVAIAVTDLGGGMPRWVVDWLNENTTTQPESGQPNFGPVNIGLGLIFIREIAAQLGLRIEATADETGTKVTLCLEQ